MNVLRVQRFPDTCERYSIFNIQIKANYVCERDQNWFSFFLYKGMEVCGKGDRESNTQNRIINTVLLSRDQEPVKVSWFRLCKTKKNIS